MSTRSAASDKTAAPAGGLHLDEAVLREVRVSLQVRLGEVELTLEELSALKPGNVLKLDTALGEPVELRLNGAVIARGEIVTVDDRFGVRVCDLGAPA